MFGIQVRPILVTPGEMGLLIKIRLIAPILRAWASIVNYGDLPKNANRRIKRLLAGLVVCEYRNVQIRLARKHTASGNYTYSAPFTDSRIFGG